MVVHGRQQGVLLLKHKLESSSKLVWIQQVTHAESRSCDLVDEGWTDASLRRPDGALTPSLFFKAVEEYVRA